MPYNLNLGRLGGKKHLFVEDVNVQPIFMSDQLLNGPYEHKEDKEKA